ncbi:adhesion G-protein coupled receptor G2-like [Saccoglossus kowalevskii]
MVNSRVISASIAGRQLKNLKDPVKITLLPVTIPSEDVYDSTQCVYWDFDANNGYGDWSSEGCHFDHVKNQRVVCHCYHLTNFAVLMDMQRKPMELIHMFALDVISRVGCLISVVGLLITMCTYIAFR